MRWIRLDSSFVRYKTNQNINIANTSYYLSGQYSSLGKYEKAMNALKEVLGKKEL